MMDKNKQIEEMAKVLYESDNKRNVVICGIETVAEDLYNADYRKASEVAREIFAEIENTARAALILLKFERNEDIRTIKTECYEDLLGYIAELKKEYTEEEG